MWNKHNILMIFQFYSNNCHTYDNHRRPNQFCIRQNIRRGKNCFDFKLIDWLELNKKKERREEEKNNCVLDRAKHCRPWGEQHACMRSHEMLIKYINLSFCTFILMLFGYFHCIKLTLFNPRFWIKFISQNAIKMVLKIHSSMTFMWIVVSVCRV